MTTAGSIQPLGAGGPHVVLAERLQHHRAGHPGEQRALGQPERDGRHDQVPQRLLRPLIQPLVAGQRQHPQRDSENVDQVQPEPERRHRDAQNRHEHDQGVDPAPAPERRDDPGRQPDQERDGQRQRRQQDRRFGALCHRLHDRPVVDGERVAEVTLEQVAVPAQHLDVPRIVQPEPLAQFVDALRRGIRPEDDAGRIARREVQQGEHRRADDEHDRDGSQDTTDDVSEHGRLRTSRWDGTVSRRRRDSVGSARGAQYSSARLGEGSNRCPAADGSFGAASTMGGMAPTPSRCAARTSTASTRCAARISAAPTSSPVRGGGEQHRSGR